MANRSFAIAGLVVSSIDEIVDNTPGKMNPAEPCGNHIVLDLGNDEYLFVAHLQPGSVKVKPGDRVTKGQGRSDCAATRATRPSRTCTSIYRPHRIWLKAKACRFNSVTIKPMEERSIAMSRQKARPSRRSMINESTAIRRCPPNHFVKQLPPVPCLVCVF